MLEVQKQNPYLSKGGGFLLDTLIHQGIDKSQFKETFKRDAKIQESTFKRTIGTYYPDLGCRYTQEMCNEKESLKAKSLSGLKSGIINAYFDRIATV